MNMLRQLPFAVLLLTLVGACSRQNVPASKDSGTVSGDASYPAIALGESVVLEVQLKDITAQPAATTLISVQRVRHPVRSPVRFSLSYPPERIVPNHRYVIEARIFDPDRVLYASAAAAVITGGNPSVQDLSLAEVDAAPGEPSANETAVVKGKLGGAGDESEYAAHIAGQRLVAIDEIRASKNGRITASYGFEGARLLTATEEISGPGAHSTTTVNFDDRGRLDAITQTRDGQPVKPDAEAAARIRNRGELLRSYALAQGAAQSHNAAH